MEQFSNNHVNLNVLKEKAYNYRWAEMDDGIIPLTAADMACPFYIQKD